MVERREFPILNFSDSKYEFVPYSLLKGHQSFVMARRVFQFLHLYQSGEPVEAPEAYFDTERGFFIIQDGHHRFKSLTILFQRGIEVVGNESFTQQISYGLYVRPFILPVYRKPHIEVFDINKIELRG